MTVRSGRCSWVLGMGLQTSVGPQILGGARYPSVAGGSVLPINVNSRSRGQQSRGMTPGNRPAAQHVRYARSELQSDPHNMNNDRNALVNSRSPAQGALTLILLITDASDLESPGGASDCLGAVARITDRHCKILPQPTDRDGDGRRSAAFAVSRVVSKQLISFASARNLGRCERCC